MRYIFLLISLVCSVFMVSAQNLPSATPVMMIINEDGVEEEVTSYDGDAPLKASFYANVKDLGYYTPRFEWTITRAADEKPFIKRFDENLSYEFLESGTFMVELKISFVQGLDTLEYTMDSPFSVTITESKLEVPNAFTPNGDGFNDILKVKEGYKSIISFKAMVFTRWGKKLYEWSNLDDGWDGRIGGSYAPDGAYFLVIDAQGADGRKYDIRKTITLIKGVKEKDTVE
ncbi:MAG: gliding motility-associated C-terminal domain-containing protein [Bacteroidaceae bacterium]|nr:gliding motility-associated C-terminal domain-containing protein [Bacteroidaceae bacterium]